MMRGKNGNSSLWAADDDDSPWAPHTVLDNAAHLKGKPPPPPPPPPSSSDPTGYYTGVESGTKWANATVTFSFPDSASDYGNGYSEARKFVAFDSDERTAFLTVFGQVNGYLSNLNLIAGATDSGADVRIGKTVTTGADAWAYYPGTGKGGDAWFNRNDAGAVYGGKGGMNWSALNPGDYTYTVFMHEFGHSLGLKHSFESGGVGGAVPHAFDSLEYTLMSYDAYQTNPYTSTVDQRNWWADDGNNPTTYMMLDIAALQHMYGADYDTHGLSDTYDLSDFPTTTAGNVFMTLWDGGGIDTYDFHDLSVPVSIDLQPGHWVTFDYLNTINPYERADLLAGDGVQWATGNIANALVYAGLNDAGNAGYIENATGGSYNDVLIGNAKDNTLTGGAGDDTFVFNSLSGLDTVADFTSGADKLKFDHTIFTHLTPVGSTLDSTEFKNTAPSDSNDFIIYDSSTGALSYDSDGNGSAGAIQVAVLGTSSHPSLLYSDILIA